MEGGTVVTFVIRERAVENYDPNDFLFDRDLEHEPSIDSLIRKFESMNQDGTKLVDGQTRPLFFDGLFIFIVISRNMNVRNACGFFLQSYFPLDANNRK